MATVTRLVVKQDVLRTLNQRDASLKALPVPLITTSAGSTTTLLDTKLGRGSSNANKYDARAVEILANLLTVGPSTGIAFVDAGAGSDDTITDSGSGLAGILVGATVVVSGSASNDGEYLVTGSAAGTLTLSEGVLTTEAAGASVTLGVVELAAVDDGGFNSTSTLTFSPAVSTLPPIATKYLLYPHGVSGDLLNQVANAILRRTEAPYHWFPSLVPDSDLSGSSVAAWWNDISNAPTTKEYATTSTNRWVTQQIFGEQSLHVTEAANSTGVKSDPFYVGDTETVVVSCFVQATVGTLTVLLYDETNSATIGTAVTIDEPAWKEVRFQVAIPAACEQATIRFSATASTGDYYVSSPVIVQAAARSYEAPSWLVSEHKVRYAFYLPQGASSEDTSSYVALSRHWRSDIAPRPTFINEARGVNPFKVILRGSATRPVGLAVVRGFDPFVHNASTTTCDRDYLVASIIARFYRDWDEQAEYRAWARRARARAEALEYNIQEVRIVPNELVTV